MLKRYFNELSVHIDQIVSDLHIYLIGNVNLIFVLVVIVLAAYGFELFNLNLTIDEEVYATYSSPTTDWISQGRWGMYLLNKFLFPRTVIPFVPLFVALIFHIGAILLLLNSWRVKSRLEQTIVGTVGITFPVMAYMYTFSTLNFGIGIGFFLVALSLFVYSKNSGLQKFLAAIPAAFAISIYQGFVPALISVFLVYIISAEIRTGQVAVKNLIALLCVFVLAILAYYTMQKIFVVSTVAETTYTAQYFDVIYLRDNFDTVLTRTWPILFLVYSGDKSIYGIEIPVLGCLIVISLLGLAANVLRSKMSIINKIFVVLFSLMLMLLPFASGLFMRGYLAMRFLVALPIPISGLIMLGMDKNLGIFKILIALLALFSVFQFVISTNHLFASSHLALQADRLLASRLIMRIEDAKIEANAGEDLKYMEIVGYYDQPSTELIPKLETFGASFFEWDQGNVSRVLLFMQTIGYRGLQALPLDRRAQLIELANSLPRCPEKGCVRVVGDTVVIKFGPYSDTQKQIICGGVSKQVLPEFPDFCKR